MSEKKSNSFAYVFAILVFLIIMITVSIIIGNQEETVQSFGVIPITLGGLLLAYYLAKKTYHSLAEEDKDESHKTNNQHVNTIERKSVDANLIEDGYRVTLLRESELPDDYFGMYDKGARVQIYRHDEYDYLISQIFKHPQDEVTVLNEIKTKSFNKITRPQPLFFRWVIYKYIKQDDLTGNFSLNLSEISMISLKIKPPLNVVDCFTIEQFKSTMNVEEIHYCENPINGERYFLFGSTKGVMLDNKIPKHPLVSEVKNENGEVSWVMHEEGDKRINALVIATF